jgi:hypothetical protein
VLLKKFFNVGFEAIAVVERRTFGLTDLSRYPLFAPEFLGFMRQVMPAHRHDELVRSITITARKPPAHAGRRGEGTAEPVSQLEEGT